MTLCQFYNPRHGVHAGYFHIGEQNLGTKLDVEVLEYRTIFRHDGEVVPAEHPLAVEVAQAIIGVRTFGYVLFETLVDRKINWPRCGLRLKLVSVRRGDGYYPRFIFNDSCRTKPRKSESIPVSQRRSVSSAFSLSV